jgi:hypothetical protein
VQGTGVDVQLGRDAGAAQGQVHDDAVLRRTDRVGATMYQKNGGVSADTRRPAASSSLSSDFKWPE